MKYLTILILFISSCCNIETGDCVKYRNENWTVSEIKNGKAKIKKLNTKQIEVHCGKLIKSPCPEF